MIRLVVRWHAPVLAWPAIDTNQPALVVLSPNITDRAQSAIRAAAAAACRDARYCYRYHLAGYNQALCAVDTNLSNASLITICYIFSSRTRTVLSHRHFFFHSPLHSFWSYGLGGKLSERAHGRRTEPSGNAEPISQPRYWVVLASMPECNSLLSPHCGIHKCP